MWRSLHSETNSGGIEVYFLFDTINSDGVNDSLLPEMVNFDVWSFCYFFMWALFANFLLGPFEALFPSRHADHVAL